MSTFHIGKLVTESSKPGTIGIIVDKGMARGLWIVRWTAGHNQGRQIIFDEEKLAAKN